MPGDFEGDTFDVSRDAILAAAFDRLRPRLVPMILRRVSSKMAARIDPEGVVQDPFSGPAALAVLSPQPKELDAWVYGQVSTGSRS